MGEAPPELTKLTVVIPTLNEVRAIGRVLEEVTAVGVPRENVVVVDGGSTDGTVEVANSYGVRVVMQEGRGKAVASSQLAAENAAKAVVAVYRVPSWSHDPSHELRGISSLVLERLRLILEELASIAETLAPEHGRATYGEPTRGLTPWDIYGKSDAERAPSYARRAVEIMKVALRELGALQPPG